VGTGDLGKNIILFLFYGLRESAIVKETWILLTARVDPSFMRDSPVSQELFRKIKFIQPPLVILDFLLV
jgi:hypothetical protein